MNTIADIAARLAAALPGQWTTEHTIAAPILHGPALTANGSRSAGNTDSPGDTRSTPPAVRDSRRVEPGRDPRTPIARHRVRSGRPGRATPHGRTAAATTGTISTPTTPARRCGAAHRISRRGCATLVRRQRFRSRCTACPTNLPPTTHALLWQRP